MTCPFSPGDFIRITDPSFAGMTATLIAEVSFSTTHWWMQLTSTDQRIKVAESEMQPEWRTSDPVTLVAPRGPMTTRERER